MCRTEFSPLKVMILVASRTAPTDRSEIVGPAGSAIRTIVLAIPAETWLAQTADVRAIALAQRHRGRPGVVWDTAAGSGSVSDRGRRKLRRRLVYAIEMDGRGSNS